MAGRRVKVENPALYREDVRRRATTACILAVAAAALIAACGDDDSGGASTDAAVPFQPRATLKAVGGTQRTDKPDFVMRVTPRPGDANIRSAAVNLPRVVLVDPAALGDVCSERELKAKDCAGHRRLGLARVRSPAFPGGLSGPVYTVSGPETGQLPGLAFVLGGAAEIVLRGRVVSQAGRIQAGVEDIPDTPLRSFEFTIEGGEDGYLILSRNLCAVEAFADGTFTSQSGERYEERIPLEADCG